MDAPQRQRREQPALSRDQIVSVALELLDTEGLDALSMRKLGTRLNAGATSMYTYVANKDELFELVVDQVYGEIEVPAADDPADWRAATTRCAHSLRSTFLQHPWIVSVLGEVGVAYLGPNMMRLSDALLGVLEDGGFSLEAADRGVSTVFAYVIGVSTTEAAWLTTVKRSGRAEQDLMESLLPAAEQAVQGHPGCGGCTRPSGTRTPTARATTASRTDSSAYWTAWRPGWDAGAARAEGRAGRAGTHHDRCPRSACEPGAGSVGRALGRGRTALRAEVRAARSARRPASAPRQAPRQAVGVPVSSRPVMSARRRP